MFSVESLFSDALRFEATYMALREQFPPGTYNAERNEAREKMESALFCAAWLEKQGVEQLPNVGPFMTLRPKKGQKLRLKRGATIYGTGPLIPREGKVATRAQVVTVFYTNEGYALDFGLDVKFRQGEVHWVGTNGWWRWSDINNFELVDSEEKTLH